jgi:hypothetical protein
MRVATIKPHRGRPQRRVRDSVDPHGIALAIAFPEKHQVQTNLRGRPSMRKNSKLSPSVSLREPTRRMVVVMQAAARAHRGSLSIVVGSVVLARPTNALIAAQDA